MTGRTKAEVRAKTIRDGLQGLQEEQSERSLADELDNIGQRCAKLPVLDERPADEILGYDGCGVPH